MSFVRSHRLRLLLSAAGLFVATQAAAAEPLAGDPLVGHWKRTWPDGSCVVTMEIRADGTMTTVDGANVVDATLRRNGPADAQGLFEVGRGVSRDNGAPTCTAGPDAPAYPDGRAKTPAADSPGHVQVGAILLFAHGDALGLCDNLESGSCEHWFRRQPASRPAATAPRATGFQAAVERGFYAVVPENSRSFELIPLSSAESAMNADGGASLGCDRSAGVQVAGDGFAQMKFQVASCRDTVAVAAWAKSQVRDARLAIAKSGPLTASDARKNGISASDESFSDGSELLYWQEVTRGRDSALAGRDVVFIDPRRGRAVLIFGIDMSMGERAPAFGSDPLGGDPAAAMKRIARGIGHDLAASH